MDTIKSTVAPDSWREAGGSIGSIRELNGQLIINQTADNHIEVNRILQQLHETRSRLPRPASRRPSPCAPQRHPLPPAMPAHLRPAAKLSFGDRFRVSIYELVTPGIMWTKELTVAPDGTITIENLGKLSVASLSAAEVQTKIEQMLLDSARGIIGHLPENGPQVSVQFLAPVTQTAPASQPATTRQSASVQNVEQDTTNPANRSPPRPPGGRPQGDKGRQTGFREGA
jgi:hypothetical protein